MTFPRNASAHVMKVTQCGKIYPGVPIKSRDIYYFTAQKTATTGGFLFTTYAPLFQWACRCVFVTACIISICYPSRRIHYALATWIGYQARRGRTCIDIARWATGANDCIFLVNCFVSGRTRRCRCICM